MKPTCPECGSERLSLVKAGSVWLACDSCDSSFVPSRERLIEACLLSHLDVTGKPRPWVTANWCVACDNKLPCSCASPPPGYVKLLSHKDATEAKS